MVLLGSNEESHAKKNRRFHREVVRKGVKIHSYPNVGEDLISSVVISLVSSSLKYKDTSWQSFTNNRRH